MASKTFKLGENAKGGIITVKATAKQISIITKEWDYSKGSNKGSDQSNAKELYRSDFSPSENGVERRMIDVLCEETTSYYAEQILEWIKSKVKLQRNEW